MRIICRRLLAVLLALGLICALAGTVSAGFTDVPADSYCAEAVNWAVARGITTGVTASSFKPNKACTRAEAVAFLWRYDRTPHYGKDPGFTDVSGSAYYYQALRWAVDRGVAKGLDAKHFAPSRACSRAQIVTLLWRYAGSPAVSGGTDFRDVDPDRYYFAAVVWAVKNGIVKGKTADRFAPNEVCTRAQIVTMLWRLDRLLPEKHLVALDPGHQSKANYDTEPIGPGSSETKAKCSAGTYGYASHLHEYQLNLTVSLQLREALERRGYWVIMTRETHDVDLSNIQRAQFANEAGADIMVRVHANGSTNASKHGAETVCMTRTTPYNPALYAKSRALSEAVVNGLCAVSGAKNNGVWETNTMTGINWSQVPVTIVEMGYMSNETEDRNMATAAYQAKLVKGICDGIDAYFAANGG